RPELDSDLETICLKCLEKDPSQRYGSAEALAEDLERWLRQEPIHARPVTFVERLSKWTHRRPATAALLLFSTLAVLSLVVGQTVMSFRLQRANRQVVATNSRMNASLRQLRWARADEAAARGDPNEAIAWFCRFLRQDPNDRVAASRLLSLLSTHN